MLRTRGTIKKFRSCFGFWVKPGVKLLLGSHNSHVSPGVCSSPSWTKNALEEERSDQRGGVQVSQGVIHQ